MILADPVLVLARFAGLDALRRIVDDVVAVEAGIVAGRRHDDARIHVRAVRVWRFVLFG